MAKVRLLFTADAVRLGERAAVALEAAGHALAIGLHDTGDLDPQPIVATVVVWSRDVAGDEEIMAACAEAADAARLIPLTLGAGAPLSENGGENGPFASIAPTNLAGWSGAGDDPRWKFILEEIALAATRPIGESAGGPTFSSADALAAAAVTWRTVAAGLGTPRALGALGAFAGATLVLSIIAFSIGARVEPAPAQAAQIETTSVQSAVQSAPVRTAAAPAIPSPTLKASTVADRVAEPEKEVAIAAPADDALAAATPLEDLGAARGAGEALVAEAVADIADETLIGPDGSEESYQDGVVAEGDADYGPEEIFDAAEAALEASIETADGMETAAIADADAALSIDPTGDMYIGEDLGADLDNAPADDPIAQLAMAATLNNQEAKKARAAPAGDLFRECTACPLMTRAPAGAFAIGSPASEPARKEVEGPKKSVRISKPFAIGAYEVTFAEWDACVAAGGCQAYRPSDLGWGRGERPVLNVSYYDALDYAAWLSSVTGARYRLPSEAEWEYAARAGASGPFSFGAPLSDARANYHAAHAYDGPKGRFRQKTLPVGQFQKNAFGLYDVHGNVWEWTADCWAPTHDGQPANGEPLSASDSGDCTRRVTKGGAWNSGGWRLRSAYREGQTIDKRSYAIGFRVVRDIDG